ncbi:MAG: isoleucine--tRNA ligase [Nitrospiraceae bacterium]|nr:isoleucine--tRNA ligase [Nitrospiraceae bacterium]
MNEKKDYKDTLNLPETAFPMKANLPHKEPAMLKGWQNEDIYSKIQKNNSGKKPVYILHDGPPYANGHIHMGHALNKVLKDIIVKHRSMKGFSSPYVPGWDCHGLPIELQVDKSLGEKKASTGVVEKRKLCREYAMKFVGIQREEFMRLGVFGLWERPYLTMTNDYEAAIVREFNNFVKGGYVYKGKKPVHWCPSCVTALAEAEVEYAEKESPSVFVRFRLMPEDSEKLGLEGEAYFVIWTTTPWTLPANLALAVNPEVEYIAVKKKPVGTYIVAGALYDSLKGDLHIEGEKVLTIKGDRLTGLRAKHPFIDRFSTVITGDFVTTGEGTGIVHIAPGHGEDDYEAGIKNGLDIYAPVDDRGKFTGTGIARIEGEFVFKANTLIIEILKENGALLLERKITHSYPHCWRCKKPVIFRATEQWFISMEHNGLREKCLREIDKVRWIPVWGRERIRGMVERRPDWCVSRQRAWGVPISLLKCKACGKTVSDPAVLDKTEAMVREHGSDVWFERPAEDFLPQGFKCLGCGARAFEKEKDILDVWFDSGVSNSTVLAEGAGKGLSWPADLYLEGSDQHRGWFQSSLIASTGTRGRAPYNAVLTHGFVVDGKGRKMSKSIGNVVSPEDIIKKSGAEILRLWVSAEDYKDDIRLSPEIIDRLTEAYRKIRNTARYLLGNISDFDGGDYSGRMLELDRWALSRLQGLIKTVDAAYENFEFHDVYHRLYNFCVVDMSSFYLDILKDRLYTFGKNSPERRAAQWVLNEILHSMTKLMAPVLSFTAEEIWGYIRGQKEESVFLSAFPSAREEFVDLPLEEKWKSIIAVRNEVNKALEIKRQQERLIGNSLEAKVTVYAPEKEFSLLRDYVDFMPALFIVSQAELRKSGEAPEGIFFASPEIEGLKVDVTKASGEKCQRCWNWSTTVGTIKEAPEICGRCFGHLS